jgi:hypothetical protein
MRRSNSVWISPGASAFSCLCEACLDHARGDGCSFVEAVRIASVRGLLPAETDVGFVRCSAGHEVIVRRIGRPPPLAHRHERQLQIV